MYGHVGQTPLLAGMFIFFVIETTSMMEALLEILDQLLYLLEQQNDESSPQEYDADIRMVPMLEALAREAVNLSSHVQSTGQGAAPSAQDMRRELLLQRSLSAIARRDYVDAERMLEEALEEFPEHDDYYNHLGLVAWERGDMARAERHYARAVQLAFCAMGQDTNWRGPDGARVLRAMEGQALCLYQMGQMEEAGSLFETIAMTCVPDYQGCYYLAGEVQHVLGNHMRAAELYRLSSSEPSVLYSLALAYYSMHDIERCTTTLLRAFRANRFVCLSLLGRDTLGHIAFEGYLGSPVYAQSYLEACEPLWRALPDALEFMGRCYDHALVQHQLQHMETGQEERSWLFTHSETQALADPSTEELSRYHGLAQRLLEHLLF